MRVPPSRMPVMWWQVVAFAVLGLLAPFVIAWLTVGPGGEFQWDALQGNLFPVTLLVCAGIATAYAARQPEQSLAVVQMLLMIGVSTDLLASLTVYSLGSVVSGRVMGRLIGIGLNLSTIWFVVAAFVALTRLLRTSLPAALATAVIILLGVAWPLSSTYRERAFWVEPYDEQESASRLNRISVVSEENFYRQPQLLEQELAAVKPQRPGVTDVFYIGMAGHGDQDVFRKEVEAVAQLMRDRFDASGHTIRLVNNRHTAGIMPIASLTSLEASLKRVATVMDREEDVLVLFLTSHGSETHRFSLDLYPMMFNELDPVALRRVLDDSGIRYRVVIVSACYSGGFVEPLKSDDTLIITASAADRNSFGCSNENEWTWFGKAYFDEALRDSPSFTAAFAKAVPVIAEREKKDGYTPSNPRIFEGAGIKAKLDRLTTQLNNGTGLKK